MNGQEILEKLKSKAEESNGDLIYNLASNKLQSEFGQVEIAHSEGDCEGGGEHSEYVFYFKDYGVYFKVTGFYSSYNGTDWEDDWTEVHPKEKTITVYK